MTTPHDAIDDELREITAPYLRSFRDDVVPANAKRKALMALGLGVATATSSTAMAAAAVGGVGRATALAVVKSIAGGALAGAVVLGASVYVQERATVAPPGRVQVIATPSSKGLATTRRADRVRETAPEPSLPMPSDREGADKAEPTELRAPVPATRAVPSPRAGSAVSTGSVRTEPDPAGDPARAEGRPVAASGASLLSREVLVLDGARAALASGDAVGAGAILDGYDREFPAGNLRPEATVLRIEARLRSGDVDGARSLAQQFERSHPGDSHLGRIRSMIGSRRASP